MYIRTIARPAKESADISVKPRLRPCCNNYVAFSKALLLCSACNDRDVFSKILREAEKESWRRC